MKEMSKSHFSARFGAFTLIELMVVVAIIAILATLSVSNFASATRRTRNSQRVSDIQTVSKGLETCYNLATASYGFPKSDSIGPTAVNPGVATGPFKAGQAEGQNACLSSDVTPGDVAYPYYYSYTGKNQQSYVVCAKLEQVKGWETVGNSTTAAKASDYDQKTGLWKNMTPCESTSTECYFCARSSQ